MTRMSKPKCWRSSKSSRRPTTICCLLRRSAKKLINAFDPTWQGAVPFTVLIDPHGKVVYREDGSIDVLAIKRAIVKALDEHEREN